MGEAVNDYWIGPVIDLASNCFVIGKRENLELVWGNRTRRMRK